MSMPSDRAWRFLHPDFDVPEELAGFHVLASGRIAMAEEHVSIRQAILLLLSTSPGERVMRPDYGCELHRLIFSPNDDTTAGLAIHYVRRAVERWEPRVEILRLEAGRNEADSGQLDIALDYRVRTTQSSDRLTFPLDLSGGLS
jgi:phage baseplate assembly protein W